MEGLPSALRPVSTQEVVDRLRAERAGSPFLLFRDGDRHQRIVELGPEPALVHVGRGPACEIALTWDGEVSRVHAVLERAGGHWTLVDDGLSRNGSFVNGRRVHGRRRLADGDEIAVGHTLLVFSSGPETTLKSTQTMTSMRGRSSPRRSSACCSRSVTRSCPIRSAGRPPTRRSPTLCLSASRPSRAICA